MDQRLWSVLSKTKLFCRWTVTLKLLFTGQNTVVFLNGGPEWSGPSEHIRGALRSYIQHSNWKKKLCQTPPKWDKEYENKNEKGYQGPVGWELSTLVAQELSKEHFRKLGGLWFWMPLCISLSLEVWVKWVRTLHISCKSKFLTWSKLLNLFQNFGRLSSSSTHLDTTTYIFFTIIISVNALFCLICIVSL